MTNMKVHYSSKSNVWNTPKSFFDKLNQEFNFELDPCVSSDGSNATCDSYFTESDNGLVQKWGAYSKVFMNPPYGREIKHWIEKAYQESLNGCTVVCLIPSRTDTQYWHEFIFPYASEIRFVKGRLKFSDSKDSAPFPSAVVIFKPEQRNFLNVTVMEQ